ncbi:MAG: hypothetical protein C0402_16675 [Thermodesulfovibrio sp.]|nr:hypothetical protein [Thermodesulfovibrio sp.]
MKHCVFKRSNKEESIMKRGQLVCMLVLALVLGLTGLASQSDAGVSVGINIDLPAYTFGAPPPLVVIPGTYAYFAPEADVDIVFYGGYWYRPYEGRWYRGKGYNGPWRSVAPGRIPGVLINLPHDYRHAYREHPRIHYRDFNRNWRNWERNRHWEKNDRWREGRHREMREDRRDQRHEERRDQRQDHRGR